MKCRLTAARFSALGERVGQPGDPTHPHPHGEVLALDVVGGDVVGVEAALDRTKVDALEGGEDPKELLAQIA